MSSNIKNILIFVAIGGAVFAGYFFFMQGDSAEVPILVSSGAASPTGTPLTESGTGAVVPGGEFLSLLLSVKSIQLNDGIFNNPAFQSLSDSSITLTLDGTEGRPNPFAPLYSEDAVLTPPSEESVSTGTTTQTTPSTSQ